MSALLSRFQNTTRGRSRGTKSTNRESATPTAPEAVATLNLVVPCRCPDELPDRVGYFTDDVAATPFNIGSGVAAARDFARTRKQRGEVAFFAVAGAAGAFTHVGVRAMIRVCVYTCLLHSASLDHSRSSMSNRHDLVTILPQSVHTTSVQRIVGVADRVIFRLYPGGSTTVSSGPFTMGSVARLPLRNLRGGHKSPTRGGGLVSLPLLFQFQWCVPCVSLSLTCMFPFSGSCVPGVVSLRASFRVSLRVSLSLWGGIST